MNLEEAVAELLEARSRINGLHNGNLGHGLLNGEVINTSRGVMGNIHVNPSAMGHASTSKVNLRGKDPTKRYDPRRNWGVEGMSHRDTKSRSLYGSTDEDYRQYLHPRTYRLTNVLDENGDPKAGIVETLTQIVREATKDDADLYQEEPMSDAEIEQYIGAIFENLKDWFVEAKRREAAGEQIEDRSTSEEDGKHGRYKWKDLKQEERASNIQAFRDRQAEFIHAIGTAGDDTTKIANAMMPAINFQKRLHNVATYLELKLQIKGLADDEFHGQNPLRIFFQDPDAIFVNPVGFWRGDPDVPMTDPIWGVGRRVDLSGKRIVLMMPHKGSWDMDAAMAAEQEWISRFGGGRAPQGLDVSRARKWISNKASTLIDPKTGKPVGYSYKDYWIDVRFTAPAAGKQKDVFDEIIEKYTPPGASRFGNHVKEDGKSEQSMVAQDSGEVSDMNVVTMTSENMVNAAMEVARECGLRCSESTEMRGRSRVYYDKESKELVLNANQTKDMETFGAIINAIADSILHKGPPGDLDDAENEMVTSAVLYNCGYDAIAKVYEARGTEAAQLHREGFGNDKKVYIETMKKVIVKTAKVVDYICGQIAGATNSAYIKKNNIDLQQQNDGEHEFIDPNEDDATDDSGIEDANVVDEPIDELKDEEMFDA